MVMVVMVMAVVLQPVIERPDELVEGPIQLARCPAIVLVDGLAE
jgi:hypothetical protein